MPRFKELMFFPQQGIQYKSCMPSILLTTNFSAQFKYLFIIIGEGDCCRCYFCGGGLREWEPGDDPWVEHARWFPNCDFVRRCKGDEFVNSIQQQAELVKNTHTFLYIHYVIYILRVT